MTFNSTHFLIFFPIVIMLYYAFPNKIRWVWLLISSYYFYMSWNPLYAILIIIATVTSWAGGLILDSDNKSDSQKTNSISDNRRKIYLAICILITLGILITFKYYSFLMNSFNYVIGKLGFAPVNTSLGLLLPVGISFYTFQVIGYLIDVYRGTTKAERNIFRYALFVSFFPQLVAGPIERSSNLLNQVNANHTFKLNNALSGLLLMMWGFFKKIVIADRAAIIVSEVIPNHSNYYGIQIACAAIIFTIQVYCDFSGYTDIAIGAAKVLDFDLMKNFDSPFLSRSITEFWRRWHISLSSWFKDYVYIPLGGNRRGKLIKYRNILITFGLSGLWHGAGWNYIFWGLLNGTYQVIEDITKKIRINSENIVYKTFQVIVTFALFAFSMIFFRADSLMHGLHIISHSIKHWGFVSMLDSTKLLGIYTFSLNEKDFYMLLLSIIVLIIVDIISTQTVIREFILKQHFIIKFVIFYLAVMFLIIFGYYGPEFDSATFIYFQF